MNQSFFFRVWATFPEDASVELEAKDVIQNVKTAIKISSGLPRVSHAHMRTKKEFKSKSL